MSIAYIALGSNLGDKEANLRQALKNVVGQRTANKVCIKLF